jgi:membrane protein YdbS with pleckstrin-like domain
MESDQADRVARLARMLEELDDVETKIEELRPASQVRSMVFVLFLLFVIAAAVLTFLVVPEAWSLSPFLFAACAYALVGLKAISSKNEDLAELKHERERLMDGPP